MRKLKNNKKGLVNIFWLLSDKVIKLFLGLFVIAAIARYLGPENYGKLNYALALVGIIEVLSALGLKGVVVTNLNRNPENKYFLLGSAFFLKLSCGFLITGIFFLLVLSGGFYDDTTTDLILILGLTVLLKSSQVVNFWFESQVLSKYVVWSENFSFVISSILKLIVIYLELDIIILALVFLFESLLIFAMTLLAYLYFVGDFKKWRCSLESSKSLLSESWPLIISSASWIIYTRIDQVMVESILGSVELGYYSAAVRISDLVNVIPSIIAFTLLPDLTIRGASFTFLVTFGFFFCN